MGTGLLTLMVSCNGKAELENEEGWAGERITGAN